MEMRMEFIARYFGSFKQKTLKVMLVAFLQVSLIFIPALAFAQLPTVNLTLDDGDASEAGPDPGSFVVTRTGSTAGALQLRVDVTGAAAFNADYTANPNMVFLGGTWYQVTIPPDQHAVTVIITPVQDGINEGDEAVNFTLVGDEQTYIVGTEDQALMTIMDDVPEVTLNLTDGDVSEGGPNPGSFTFTRSDNGIISQALQLRVDVTGAAAFNSDYTANPNMIFLGGTWYQVTIPPDQHAVTVIITPVQDGINEGDEAVNFTLVGDGLTYTVGEPANATITIADFVEGIFKDSFEGL
jgi:hypothetical protein